MKETRMCQLFRDDAFGTDTRWAREDEQPEEEDMRLTEPCQHFRTHNGLPITPIRADPLNLALLAITRVLLLLLEAQEIQSVPVSSVEQVQLSVEVTPLEVHRPMFLPLSPELPEAVLSVESRELAVLVGLDRHVLYRRLVEHDEPHVRRPHAAREEGEDPGEDADRKDLPVYRRSWTWSDTRCDEGDEEGHKDVGEADLV